MKNVKLPAFTGAIMIITYYIYSMYGYKADNITDFLIAIVPLVVMLSPLLVMLTSKNFKKSGLVVAWMYPVFMWLGIMASINGNDPITTGMVMMGYLPALSIILSIVLLVIRNPKG